MDRVGVARKIHCVNPVCRIMPLQPLHTSPVGRQPVLAEQVFAHSQHIGGIKQRLMFGGHEIKFCGALEPFFDGNFIKVPCFVCCITQSGSWRLFPAKFRVFVEILLHQAVVGQVFPESAAK